MIARFQENKLLRACTWIASERDTPVLSFVRHGDRLEIMGSDAYVMACGEVDAEFEEWPDVEGFAVKGFCRDECSKLVGALEYADAPWITVELDGGAAKIGLDDVDASATVVFAETGKPPAMEKMTDALGESPEGHALLGVGFLQELADLVGMLSPIFEGWFIEPHGPNRVMIARCDEPPLGIHDLWAAVMPQREEAE